MESNHHNNQDPSSGDKTIGDNDAVPGHVSDQAIEWLARLRAEDLTAQESADFAEWLAADSAHERAFDEATALWHLAAEIKIPTPTEIQPASRAPRWLSAPKWAPVAAAASVLIAFLIGFSQFTDIEYSTGKGEQRRVVLADGSVAFLNTASTIEVDYSASERSIEIIAGEVWFDVAKNPNKPFVVTGKFARAQAVGTAFSVRQTKGFTSVSVSEGRVSMLPQPAPTRRLPARRDADDELLLDAGEAATAYGGNRQLHPEPHAFDAAAGLAWRHGQLIYDNVSLAELVADLNRYLPKPMSLNDGDLAQRRVSAVLSIDDQQAMLDALASTLPIKWKAVDGGLIIITKY